MDKTIRFGKALRSLPVDARLAIDVMSVAKRVRRLGLLHVPLQIERELRSVLNEMELVICARRELVRSDDPVSREGILNDPSPDDQANYLELWFCRSDEHQIPSPDALFRNPGGFLGYPPCCVEAWERLRSQRDLYHRYLFETQNGLWEINRLSAVFHPGLLTPDFFPCALSCPSARDFVAPVIELARQFLDHAWVEEARRYMRAPLLEGRGQLYAFPSWELEHDDLCLYSRDAKRVALADIASFDLAFREPLRLISFAHFSGCQRVVVVGAEGQRVPVDVEYPEP